MQHRWPLTDVVVALVVVAAFWLPPLLSASSWPRIVLGAALALVTALAVMLRQRFPAAASASAAVATVAAGLLGVCQDPMLAAAWCLYALAAERAGRTGNAAVVVACLVAGLLAVSAADSAGRLIPAAVALTAAWLLGTANGRQLRSARSAERARVQLDVAREVHDVVGHALGVISAQAGVTRALPDADERELRGTLGDIESHARDALQEMQVLVRGLRDVRPAAGPGDLSSMSDDLSSLIADARAAGLIVDARIDAGPDVGDGTQLVVFRTVQEALSNVLRHAPGARCSVRVTRSGREIKLRIRDHGSPFPGGGPGSGLGLQGMRERAALAGGTVSWQHMPGGGFQVDARLPAAADR